MGLAGQHGDALGLRVVGGGVYGILAGSLRKPTPVYGLPFGATVWVTGYIVLPEAGLYKPIWEYDAKTLASDLSAHLAYGAGTGTAFWLLAKIWQRAGRRHVMATTVADVMVATLKASGVRGYTGSPGIR